MREFKDSVTGMDEKPSASPAELPSAGSEPDPVPAEKTERETVS
jgi:hypothetical protein